jgi:AraC-like DNA-binding protein
VQSAVKRAIETMWEHYCEPISLSDLADAAILSRFYFSRVFRDVTGTSPGRFLAAIRLYQAKRLLRDTTTSVTEISYYVGYNSPGTFTSRFTRSVGMSPTRYREYAQLGLAAVLPVPPGPDPRRGTVVGNVKAPAIGRLPHVYIGVFNSAVPEGLPVSCDVLEESGGRFGLNAVPDGVWYVRAAAVDLGCPAAPAAGRRLLVGASQPVVARAGRIVETDLELRETGVFDLPVLLALPDLDCRVERESAALVSVG